MGTNITTQVFVYIFFIFHIFQVDAKLRHPGDQDIIINNVVIQDGIGDCHDVYAAIKPILSQYKRAITVLDLGAGHGYFTFSIANERKESTCVMVEDDDDSQQLATNLLDLCHLNTKLQNLILLKKRLSLAELDKLADCEHFDVILALDYIDYEANDWKERIDAILRLGNNIFVQAPWTSISHKNIVNKKVVEYLEAQSGKLILQTPCSNSPENKKLLFWFERVKSGLWCKSFNSEGNDINLDSFRIESSYTKKVFVKKGKPYGTSWKNGINLVTFLMLNGVYPTKKSIKRAVAKLKREKLTDFFPKNIIIQGKNVVLIDQNDKGKHIDVQGCLDFINEAIDQASPADVLNVLNQHRPHLRKNKSWLSWLLRL